jgi:hypothetical protein
MTKEKIKPTEEIILNQKLVREYLHYDEATGVLTWKVNRKGKAAKAGSTAGHFNAASGNVYIRLFGISFLASHLIFFYQTSRLPPASFISTGIAAI